LISILLSAIIGANEDKMHSDVDKILGLVKEKTGYTKTWISEIRRNGKDVSLEAATEFDSFSGRFGNLFG